jgi:hypothetical protein
MVIPGKLEYVWEGLVVGIASGFNNGIQERKKNLS